MAKGTSGRKTPPKKDPARENEKKIIRELADLLTETGLTEIEIERTGLRVRVARGAVASAGAVAAPTAPAPPSADADTETVVAAENHPGVVRCPMVGTAYLAPEPGTAPFVDEDRFCHALLIHT